MIEKFNENNPEHLDRTKYKVVKWELDGRHPTDISFGSSFKEDACRRDFSFNALALNSAGQIIDYFNGIDDLHNGTVKAIGCPYDRFGEDVLRIMRAIRFAVKCNFEIEKCTSMAIKDCSDFLSKVSIERIYDELYKMASLGGIKFAKAIELLDSHDILEKILPEITCMKNYLHACIHHPEGAIAIRKSDHMEFEYDNKLHNNSNYIIKLGTVWDHTIAAIKQSTSFDPEINLAILFHDVGKPVSFVKKFDEKKGIIKYTYHGHDYKGVEVFENIAKRFKLSNEFKEKVNFCIVNHMKFHLLNEMKITKIVPLITHKYWNELMYVSYCDDSCRKNVFNQDGWNKTIKRIDEIKSQLESQKESLSFINGINVMKICNIKQGSQVGKIIKASKDIAIKKNINNESELIEIIKSCCSIN